MSCTPAVVPGSGTLARRAAALRCFCLLSWIISGSFGKNHESLDFLNVFLSFADVQVEQTGRLVKVLEESCLLEAVLRESKHQTGRPAPTGGSPTRFGAALTRLSHL